MSGTEAIIETKFLSVCPAPEAVNWLREKREALRRINSIMNIGNEMEELALAARKDPYIDFGLARYGTNEKAGREVYERGDKAIRITYLAHFPNGGFYWTGDQFELSSTPPSGLDELAALATNPALPDSMYESLFEQEGVFHGLSDEDYKGVIVAVSENKRLMTPYDNLTLDGWAEHSYNKVFAAAWQLGATVPNTTQWATILYQLLSRCETPIGFDPVPIFGRWHFTSETTADPKGPGFFLRSRLADVMQPDDALLRAQDPALRDSFYRRFQPYRYSNWVGFSKEGELFLEATIRNQNLWQKRETRESLSQLCWACPDPRSNMDMPNSYRWAEDRYRREHPNWFQDEE